MPELKEAASARISDLRKFDPLLDALVDSGRLADAEADLVLLTSEATSCLAPVRLATPGGSSALATAVALHVAVRAATHPGRYPAGPVALLSGSVARQAALALEVNGTPIAAGLSTVRLRADGMVQAVSGSRVTELDESHRLLFVSSRAQWPDLACGLGVAILDRLALGASYEEAHRWALRWAKLVHVVAELDPNMTPSSLEVDWPLIASDPGRWCRTSSWPVLGEVRIDLAGDDPNGLLTARERIADAARSTDSWPGPLSAAAGLSRALASVTVPLGLYDVHTVGTIAQPFAERLDQLGATRGRDLPDGWAAFAETSWAVLKQGLLDAATDLEDRNDKAEQIGMTVERLLAEDQEVDVWLDSAVHGRALQTHLLSAGFAITAADFDEGRIAVRTYSEAHRSPPSTRVSVFGSLPTNWQLPGALAGGVGGPLSVVAYPFEAKRAPRLLAWALNAGRQARHAERIAVLRRVLGPGLEDAPVPNVLEPRVTTRDPSGALTTQVAEYGEDAAEFAALADDDWLALALQAREQSGSDPGAMRPAVAYLVEPGPQILLLADHALVDRVVGGRLRPVPASSLEAGMKVLGANASGGVFAAIRPHLDRLVGPATRFWLDQWDDALRNALIATGGPSHLAERLQGAGATISTPAVASWASPYRIGPRDPTNVRRVAEVGAYPVVSHNYRRVHAVMRGVRVEHGRLGRQLAAALRLHVGGDDSAFDPIEDRLGLEIETMLGNPTVYTVIDRLTAGCAPANALGRAHPVHIAQELFRAQENQ